MFAEIIFYKPLAQCENWLALLVLGAVPMRVSRNPNTVNQAANRIRAGMQTHSTGIR